ncbi:hypothetical protein [Streptomyces rochei]|uniref:hypothetical protein n=1 Tax=Streptomyces rochei TaxID=1928 RepID=UPI0036979FF1
MARHWYSSSPVVEGLTLLDEPGFCPAYLADLAEGFAPEAFGSDAGDAETMLDTLQDRSAWPRFVVPLARRLRDRRARQQRRGVHHDGLLPHAFRLAQDLVLASDGEDRIGPGLCWPELAALLVAPPGAAGVTDSHAQLLLLLPVLGDAAVPEEAVTAVVEALVAQGAPEASEALARHLLRGHPGAPRTGVRR